MTKTLTLNKAKIAALIKTVDSHIDMYNDMAVDPLYFRPDDIREMAQMTDEQIRKEINDQSKEAEENIATLVQLELIYAELINL